MVYRFFPNAHFPGCLPEGDCHDFEGYDNAEGAWQDIINGIGDGAWTPDDENDPEGPQSMRPEILEMERMRDANREGSVQMDNMIYEVSGEWVDFTQTT